MCSLRIVYYLEPFSFPERQIWSCSRLVVVQSHKCRYATCRNRTGFNQRICVLSGTSSKMRSCDSHLLEWFCWKTKHCCCPHLRRGSALHWRPTTDCSDLRRPRGFGLESRTAEQNWGDGCQPLPQSRGYCRGCGFAGLHPWAYSWIPP